jgi:signal transduction histidine kinase
MSWPPGWRADAWRIARVAGVAFGLSLLWLAMVWSDPAERPLLPPVAVQLAVAALASWAVAALGPRRPVLVALPALAVGVLFVAPMGASIVAVYQLGVRRPWRTTALVLAGYAVAILVLFRGEPAERTALWELVLVFVLPHVVAATVGVLARSRRELVDSLRERARQAEEGQRLRIEEARHLERERIAREMHDVLAHRLSLLAVHAGALEFGSGVDERQQRAAGVIRQGAHDALEDLRVVLGMLRDTEATAADDRPQPQLADLPDLVGQSRQAGAEVALESTVSGEAPTAVGRHAYRIVQEGLTNARKHAPGAPVRVIVTGDPAAGLTVAVVNPIPPGQSVRLPGAGAGLVGLAERVRLLGGRLEHGLTDPPASPGPAGVAGPAGVRPGSGGGDGHAGVAGSAELVGGAGAVGRADSGGVVGARVFTLAAWLPWPT